MSNDNEFGLHPDYEELTKSYKGFQGADPEKARVVFVGRDANFPVVLKDKNGDSPFIEHSFYKDHVKKYLEDFNGWYREHGRKNQLKWSIPWNNGKGGIHHPFLLPLCENWDEEKNQGLQAALEANGQRFHLKLWLILSLAGVFAHDHVKHISFCELLKKPTKGGSSNTKDEYGDLLKKQTDKKKYFARIFENGKGKLIVLMFGSAPWSLIKEHLNEYLDIPKPHKKLSRLEPVVEINAKRKGVKVLSSIHPSYQQFPEPLVLELASRLKKHLQQSKI